MRLIPEQAHSVLDFGCGAGEFTQKLADRFGTVVGTDIEPILSIARQKHPALTLVEWNGESEVPSELSTYDVVFSKLVLPFIENVEQVAHNFRRITNEDGVVVISVPNPKKIAKKFGLNPAAISKYDDEVGSTGIKIHPTYRPLEKYVEIFSEAGFEVSEISKPLVSDDTLKKYNVSPKYNDIPSRLNMKFSKLS